MLRSACIFAYTNPLLLFEQEYGTSTHSPGVFLLLCAVHLEERGNKRGTLSLVKEEKGGISPHVILVHNDVDDNMKSEPGNRHNRWSLYLSLALVCACFYTWISWERNIYAQSDLHGRFFARFRSGEFDLKFVDLPI